MTFPSESESPYDDYIKGYRGRKNTYSRPGNPEQVAKTIEKIIDSNRPKFRYVLGKEPKIALALKNIIPDHLSILTNKLIESGALIEIKDKSLIIQMILIVISNLESLSDILNPCLAVWAER